MKPTGIVRLVSRFSCAAIACSAVMSCGGAESPPAVTASTAGAPSAPPGAPSPSAAVSAPAAPPVAPPTAATPPAQPPTGPEPTHVAKVDVTAAIARVVGAPDRAEKDRELDAGRHPAELLAFAAIGPGMHVADVGAGLGYTTELLARAVGPTGVVYSQNSKFVIERFAAKPWGERLAKPALKNVVRVERDGDDPLPPDAKNLDAVLMVLVYHDAVWMGVDRDKLNRAVWAALKPGGEYVVVDHSAKDGSGLGDVKTYHRIDEHAVVDEVTRAGFRLAEVGDFLRNPADTRDWNDAPMAAGDRRGKSDRFVLKFVKP
jgi:predicted methyltransferase